MDLLILIFSILIVLWLLGWGFAIGGSMIHLLLALALIILVIRILQGRTVL